MSRPITRLLLKLQIGDALIMRGYKGRGAVYNAAKRHGLRVKVTLTVGGLYVVRKA